ncbi:MAG TPA: hypothetical protein VFK09_13570 [Gemmatimonadales bacterium]|jgi:hypothetical protein|nr:hypothetical protein [Gemmatimonadales bacterium]
MTAWKQGLGALGVLLAAGAVLLERPALVWAAIGLLAASVLLRVLDRVRSRRRDGARDAMSDRPDE